MSLPDDVRAACARVAANARHVRIVEAAIEPYAATLPAESPPAPDYDGTLEQRAAFSLTLNAINFGSGWFPTLRKVDGKSGFWTVESALRAHGPFTADELASMTQPQVADVIGQDPEHELMGLFAEHLRELGSRVREQHDRSFFALACSGDGSAVRLAEELGSWDGWRDVSVHDGQPVPLFKRAQLAAADLALAGIAPADDLAALTLFADNLVPHVLRIDGVLEVDPDVVARIDAGQLLVHDSPEEVEIRACAVHAVDLLVAAHGATTAMAADNALWHRGGGPRYKAHPRHRARTTDY